MESHQTIQGLDWLNDEVEASLTAACDALNVYRASQDEGSLANCLGYFRQVQGCLKIIELDSGVLLLAEMEQVVVALRDKRLGNVADASEVLAQAAGLIPGHLARLQAGVADHTGPLVPILNDLRAVRGEQLFSELVPVSPHLAALAEEVAHRPPVNEEVFRKRAKKLRQHYQAALLGLFRDQSRETHLCTLDRLATHVAELCAGVPRQQLWCVAAGFVEGLRYQHIGWGCTARVLLRELERELRGYAEVGSKALVEPFPRRLMVNLFYYVAAYGGDSHRVNALRESFHLSETVFGGRGEGRKAVLDSDVVNAVAGCLRQELETVKERVEEFIATGDGGLVKQALAILRRMADTLTMANQLDLQKCCQAVVQFIAELDSTEPAGLDTLAISIVDLEAGISVWQDRLPGTDGEEEEGGAARALAASGALVQLLEETGRELEAIKRAVLVHCKAGVDSSGEETAPMPLVAVSAAVRRLATVLQLADMARCAAIVNTLGDCLESRRGEVTRELDWQELDALADTLTAVEYYLDNRCAGRLRDDESLLGLAELAVIRLARSIARNDTRLGVAPVITAIAESEQDSDPAIRAIFVEEAREVLDTVSEFFPLWVAGPDNGEALAETRRAFHTLKGSGRMVGADAIGNLAWALENLLNRVLEGRVAATPALVSCLQEAIAVLPDMVLSFEQGRPGEEVRCAGILAETADRLANGDALDTDAPAGEAALAPDAAIAEPDNEDRQLLKIFTREAHGHLAVVRQFIVAQYDKAPFLDPPSPEMQSALHTLKGSTHMAAVEPLAELITSLERLMRDMLNFQVAVDEDILDLLADSLEFSERMVVLLDSGRDGINIQGAELAELQARMTELRERALGPHDDGANRPSVNPAFLQLLMGDGMQRVLDIERTLVQWQEGDTFDMGCFVTVAGELAELRDSAEKAGYTPLVSLADRLADSYDHLAATNIAANEALVEILMTAHETLLCMVDTVAAHQEMVPAAEELLAALTAMQQLRPVDETAEVTLAARIDGLALPDNRDDEIFELFLEEADELLGAMELCLHHWREAPHDRRQPESLQRFLHTFKGGARMAGLAVLGEISHDLESAVIAGEAAVVVGDIRPLDAMLGYYDALSRGVERMRQLFRLALARDETAMLQASVPTHAEEAAGTRPSADILPFVGTSRGLGATDSTQSQQAAATQEVVRVAAPVLDMLVNLAGETSISRSQVEQHVSEFMASLEEMDATIRRMHDQVRRLGIETDAQVVFRREQIESSESSDGFDPLEMDRYSQLQQLSRSLLEAASDLQDLRGTLVEKSRRTESILQQQSLINTDLQEGLMRTRMVPFSRMVPRLRRVVGQMASSLGKEVGLQLESIEGEMDRTVLERIVPSLEHMIRNAVDHGIESADERRAHGKPAGGTLTLSLEREGADILIRLADDGRGLDVDAIRARAVATGLVSEGALLSDHDLQQYIFTPGFSTSREVTQVSGRGVGMDVVNSDVRQLGGAITINSRQGIGTEFTVRLPFTVSVNRALMIEVGEDSYALPLNSISGVTRIAVGELTRFYQNPHQRFQYGGEEYEVRHLGSLLWEGAYPTLDTALGRQLPVVLIRQEGRRYAVQVDGLIGSREVVVKTLGAQFSQVPGLSGATVLGDGRVVVILDLQALLRDELAMMTPLPVAPVQAREEGAGPTFLVVDDSVTVRKVTGRFLEREGYRVITAKDGVDAMRLLQDNTPDVMLLDIEMPRMDGFEVARLVRSTQRLKNLPIVMITSRTGEKHRERALAMGVDHYLGKPYQEEVLLQVVRELLERRHRSSNTGEVG